MCLHQRQRRLCIRWLIPLVIVLSVSGCAADAPAAEPQMAVLALYGSRPDLPTNVIVDEIIRSTLERELGSRLDFYAEFLDTSRWPEGETQIAVHDFLRRRYANKKLSVIIAVARSAINFMRIYGDELFPGVPIVAYGDVDSLRDWEPGRPIAGALAKVDLSETVELALRLQPGTREILVISGTSDSDLWRQSGVRRQLDWLEKRVKLTYMEAGSVQDYLTTVAHVPDGTVILFLTMYQDSAGNKLLSHEVLTRIAKAGTGSRLQPDCHQRWFRNCGWGCFRSRNSRPRDRANHPPSFAGRAPAGSSCPGEQGNCSHGRLEATATLGTRPEAVACGNGRAVPRG